jgi:hypothetical protein
MLNTNMTHSLELITKDFIAKCVDEVYNWELGYGLNISVRKGNSKFLIVISYISKTDTPKLDYSDSDTTQFYLHIINLRETSTQLTSNLEKQIGHIGKFDVSDIEDIVSRFLIKFEPTKQYVVMVDNLPYISTDTVAEAKELFERLLLHINVSLIQSAYIVDTINEDVFINLYDKNVLPFNSIV